MDELFNLEYIETLPLANSPEVFGLHANAEIGYYTTAAKEMWYHLIELQPQTGDVAGGISRDEYIDRVASDVLAKLPKEFEMDKIRKKFGIDISPTTVVLFQELERFNNLLRRMQRSLVTLKKVSFSINLIFVLLLLRRHNCKAIMSS